MNGSAPLSLEEAQARLLALVTPLSIERVDIEGALGRFLAEPLHARRTQPSANLSAMDGYAVTAGDMRGPWRIVGESAAGHPYVGPLSQGEAVRISTGAMLPPDAAAVIIQEDLTREGANLILSGEPPAPAHKHIRHCGMDFAQGVEVLPAGLHIAPAQMALAIAAGHTHLPVHRTPRLTVIDSGDELASDPERCAPHQVPASNGAMLTAMARSLGVDARRIGPVPDTIKAITSAFEASADADLIVTSGGASVGDHDLIRPALESWGAGIDFWRVAIKPGKPILVATRDVAGRRQIVLGLPGNPVSSYVTAYHFLLPVLRAMQGAARPLPMRLTARLAMPLHPSGRRREFLRGWWDGENVTVSPLQDSGALSSLAASNVLVDRSALAGPAQAGEEVRIYLLQNGGIA
ncbi:molybdopterin molybdotransferase MoeA [Novosphingobium resinovorum]|uniref:Molybdopterin molybdenumtransferase n=1 Tax=Novosphingobium resinovorum TaxID=158500 RepID=A0A031K4L5_9SPHN|nr:MULTISPECIES: molybdopterin molybdotransferase MoeA [Novosphingobium]EZP84871.1 Molybdopterin molybdochelatase [Novosphingobium resinovorum]MBF7011237.1 molybdopterin molybdotransferase MoeA [Novosphingobium sp. HR1a]WJM29221.1 molybdopterin molybdotransferase MoeA [Novosphingobium resinovorum]